MTHICGSKGRAGEECRDPEACANATPRNTREDGWARAHGVDPAIGDALIRNMPPEQIDQCIRLAAEMACDVVRLRETMQDLAGHLDDICDRLTQQMTRLEEAEGRIETEWGYAHAKWPIDVRGHWGMLETARQLAEDQWAAARKQGKAVERVRDLLGEQR